MSTQPRNGSPLGCFVAGLALIALLVAGVGMLVLLAGWADSQMEGCFPNDESCRPY